MSDDAAVKSVDVVVSPVYEPPRLTPIGNLRDLLAGGASLFCDGGAPASPGIDPFVGPTGPDECGAG
ncbi:MAG: hypothetical protein JWM82_3948 [Myxococcales bacterium]|nr:hypothetical protein [Myxococcales bacterium]